MDRNRTYKVILSYLNNVIGSSDTNQISKADKAKQTKAVEDLMKNLLNGPLSQYKDNVYAVGGSVRDELLGKNPKDLDMVVDDPKEKMDGAKKVAQDITDALNITTANNPHPLKEQYGIWGVTLLNPKSSSGERKPFIYKGTDISGYVLELTPPRKEGPYDTNKREPEYVEYTSLEDDAHRRDLTINALYKNLATNEVKDFVGGKKDLQEKTLRPPKHPEGIKRIYEDDPLRIFRLVRFGGKLDGFKLDPQTEKEVKEFINSPEGKNALTQRVSKERVRDELTNMITHPQGEKAVEALELMREMNLLEYISPNFDKMLDMFHDTAYHQGESIWQHTMDVLKKTPPSLKARLGALFHDIGKLSTRSESVKKDDQGNDVQRVHFIGHEDIGPAIAEKALSELKYPKNVIKPVVDMIGAHMGLKTYGSEKNRTRLRKVRILIEKLYNNLDDALSLMEADANNRDLHDLQKMREEIKNQKEDDLAKGLLKETPSGAEYISPLSGEEIKKEYDQLKGQQIGAVKWKLKQMLLQGKFDALDGKDMALKAREVLKGITSDQNQLEAIMAQMLKKSKSKSFYK